MTMTTTLPCRHPLTGQCYSTDREILHEIAEALAQEVGDVRYGSTFVDTARRQIHGKLEDGRTIRLTVIIE